MSPARKAAAEKRTVQEAEAERAVKAPTTKRTARKTKADVEAVPAAKAPAAKRAARKTKANTIDPIDPG